MRRFNLGRNKNDDGKGMGLVPDVYNKDSLARLIGNVGVGHVRYSTTGGSKIENCQPFILNFKGGTVAIAHNGNLVNAKTLKDELEWEDRQARGRQNDSLGLADEAQGPTARQRGTAVQRDQAR